MKLKLIFVCVCIGLLVLFNDATAQQKADSKTAGYLLLKKIETGGEGGWDYLFVDSNTRRLYISRSTHVMVLDTDTGASVGDIPGTNGVHGIAVATDLGKGFTSNGRDGTVSIFQQLGINSISTKRNVFEDCHRKI